MKEIAPYKEMFNSKVQVALPSVYDHFNTLDSKLADEVIDYLERGIVIAEFVSPIRSPIDKTKLVPYVFYCDGEYRWDGMLIHLIRDYSVAVPEVFLKHILSSISYPIDNPSLDPKKLYKAYIAEKKSVTYLMLDGSQCQL